MIEAARVAGFQRLWACPEAENLRSRALLDRAGFIPYTPTDASSGTAYLERNL
ncbi:hypothetical protein [Deinococcus taeanensis]|uniref:hypothetical protein n=1 Tax=Deinococcus taeanensis TaxID=2737050 RepID=UPI003D817141